MLSSHRQRPVAAPASGGRSPVRGPRVLLTTLETIFLQLKVCASDALQAAPSHALTVAPVIAPVIAVRVPPNPASFDTFSSAPPRLLLQ